MIGKGYCNETEGIERGEKNAKKGQERKKKSWGKVAGRQRATQQGSKRKRGGGKGALKTRERNQL